MALRFRATALERELTSRVQLELISSASPVPHAELAAPQECPSADDLLDLCQGKLPRHRALSTQQHLDHCASCLDVVTLALNDWELPTPAEWLEVAPNFRPGERVDGRYEIVRFIASGGMGEVYEAVDRCTGERVALKAVLAAACDHRDLLRCFRQEARLARRVRHPNVCRVHDAAAPDEASARPLVPYFTMELVEGETLHARIERGPLTLDETLEIARQLLLGIQAIHRAGVLHLDLKSNNIMLRRGSSGTQVVVLDFGLARRLRDGTGNGASTRVAGRWPLVTATLSSTSTPSVRDDLLAFGAVLLQMLSGELSLRRMQTARAASAAEYLTAKAPSLGALVFAVSPAVAERLRRCVVELEQTFPGLGEALDAVSAVIPPSLP